MALFSVAPRGFEISTRLTHSSRYGLLADATPWLQTRFDLEVEHGEPPGQFLRRPVEINLLFQPVERDFHLVFKLLISDN